MHKFIVTYEIRYLADIEVDATNQIEAEDLANKQIDNIKDDDLSYMSTECINVERMDQ